MKNKIFFKYLFTTIISLIMILTFSVYSNAFSLNITSNEKNINKGDTITVTVTADSKFVTSDFELKYDADLFEYVEETQTNVSIKDYPNDGYLIIVYADISGNGTNAISVKFKSKATTNATSQFSIQKQNFTDIDGTSYDSSTATANSLSVSVKENSSNTGTSGSQNGNNGNTGTPGSQNGNSGSTGTSGSQNGNNGSTGTSGSQNGNNGSTGTSGSQNGNSGNTGTSGSQSGNKGNTGTTTSSNKNSINTASTQKSNSSLPKTGIGFNILVIFIILAIIMAVIFRKKIKYWNGIGMFILAFTITVMLSSGNIYAYTKKHKYGVYNNLIKNQNVLAISFDKDETERELKVSQIPSLVDNVSSCKDKKGNTISENSTIGTGSKVQLKDNTEYVVLLYGDVTGDGKINSNDIYPIIQHILKNQTLTGVYAKAANLNNKNDENDQNINSSDIYQIIKFMLGDLKNDLVYDFPSKSNEELDLNIAYDKKDWTKDSVIVTISSSTELVVPDGNWQLSENKKQISKTYNENTSETLNIKSADGRNGNIDVVISNIDKNAPNISGNLVVNPQTASVGDNIEVTVNAEANDTESGIDKIMYEVYRGNEKVREQEIVGSTAFTFQAVKGVTYQIRMYSIDKAGNTSGIETMKMEQLNYLDTDAGQKDLNDETVRYNNNLNGLNDAISEKKDQLANINNTYYAKKSEINDELQQKLKVAEAEKEENLYKLNKKFNNIVNELTEEKDNKLARAKSQYDDEIAAAKKQGATTAQINDIKKAYSNKKQSIQDDYEQELKMRERQCKEEENDVNNTYNQRKINAQRECEEEISNLDTQHEQQIAPINNDINNFVGARNSVITGYNSYKASLENKVYIYITK